MKEKIIIYMSAVTVCLVVYFQSFQSD